MSDYPISQARVDEMEAEIIAAINRPHNVKVLALKAAGNIVLPEESHTAGRIYAMLTEDGSEVKTIGIYGDGGEKHYEIHTTPHRGLTAPHFHLWKHGSPLRDPETGELLTYSPILPSMDMLLNNLREEIKAQHYEKD